MLERANKLFLQTANHIADNYAALFSKKDTLLITDHFKNSWDYANFDFPDKKILLVPPITTPGCGAADCS